MSVEDLRSVSGRAQRLSVYIDRMPKNVGGVDKTVLETKMVEAFRMLRGRHYRDVVKDLNRLLPETLDQKLREVQEYCGKLGAPYGPHIISEVAGILLELQSFRSSHGWVSAGVVEQHARMPTIVEMRALLGRLQILINKHETRVSA